MAVTGLSAWWIAVLIGGNTFRYKRMERDEDLIRDLIAAEAEFWDRVQRRDPPAPDGTEATGRLLKALYPTSAPETVMDLPPDALPLVDQYWTAKADMEAAEARKTDAENKLKAVMGDIESAWAGDKKILWKSQVRRTVDTKALKAELPDISERFMRESISRPFAIKLSKGR